jgi:hypothetical protein
VLCFKSNKTLCDCDGTVLLNVYIYVVFVGEEWLTLVPSRLPHLRQLSLWGCDNVRYKYVEELVAAVPELEIINFCDKIVEAVRNKHPENT